MTNEITISSDNKNPCYDYFYPIWKQQRDCFEGEWVVKKAVDDEVSNSFEGELYLPLPSGKQAERLKNKAGVQAFYKSYKKKADFPEWLSDSVLAMVGMMFQDSGNVELPESLQYLNDESVTDKTLLSVSQETAFDQLIEGRVFWLWTVNEYAEKGKQLYPVKYPAISILDWVYGGDGLEYLLLDESGYQRINNKWDLVTQYRVCAIDESGFYWTGLVKDNVNFNYYKPEESNIDFVYPELNGVKFEGIPGVMFNAVSLGGDPEMPITMAISEASLKAYQNSADQQHALHLTAQPTLIVLNAKSENDLCLGSSVVLEVGNSDQQADIKFLEVTGIGIDKLKESIDSFRVDAKKSTELIENGQESGIALNTKVAVKTAGLSNVANTNIKGMKKFASKGCVWSGVKNPEIVFSINTDFRKDNLTVDDIVKLGNMVNQGLLPKEDLYVLMKKAKKTKFETYEEWSAKLEEIGGIAGSIVSDLNGFGNDGE